MGEDKLIMAMRYKSFDIEKYGSEYQLRRTSNPRINLIIDCSRDISLVRKIIIIDDCTPEEMKNILDEVEEFIQRIEHL